MPKLIYPEPFALPPAWRTKDGRSITELVGNEVQKRRFHVDSIIIPISDVDPTDRSQLAIEHHHCQILPARIIEPDPKRPGDTLVRLHPASKWASTLLIYVLQDYPRRSRHTFFVLPTDKKTKGGAWSIPLKSLLPNKDAWHLLKMVAAPKTRED